MPRLDQRTADPDPANNAAVKDVTIVPGSLQGDVVAGDPDWQGYHDEYDDHHGHDDVTMTAGTARSTAASMPYSPRRANTNYVLKATKPSSFGYRLSLTNETGIDIHTKGKKLPKIARHGVTINDRNGGSMDRLPDGALDAVRGRAASAPYPLTDPQKTEPAFVLKGWLPVIAHPNDRTDGMPISVKYVPLNYRTDTIGGAPPLALVPDCSAPEMQDEYCPCPGTRTTRSPGA